MECCIESCDRNAYTQELCRPHYQRLQRHGDPFADIPIGRSHRSLRLCSVPHCEERADGRGLCHGHYQRWKRNGDVEEEVPLERRRQPERCSVDGCDRRTQAKGYCGTHYKRAIKHGDVQADTPIRVVTGEGWLSHGYWYVPVAPGDRHLSNGDTQIAEHRLIINRLENLELWSTTQPKGQRVPDKVAFAVDLLRRYAPELLYESHLL